MKKMIKVVALSCLLVFMSGCVKMRVGINIIDKDEVETTMVMLIQKQFISSYEGIGEDPFENMLSTYEDMDTKIKEIEEKDDGITYVGYEVTIYDDEYNQDFIDNYLSFDEVDGKEVYSLNMPLDEMSNQMDMGNYGSGMDGTSPEQMEEMGAEITMTFTFPYDITETSAGEVDGNTVTIDMFELMNDGVDEVEVIAEESSSSNILLYVAIAIIVIAGAAIAFIVIRNKKKVIPENMNNDSVIDDESLTSNTEENQDSTNTDETLVPTEETISEENQDSTNTDEPLVPTEETISEENQDSTNTDEPLVPTEEEEKE